MTEYTQDVSVDDFLKAMRSWEEMMHNTSFPKQNPYIFIGRKDFKFDANRRRVLLTDLAFEKIRMMASPHGYTVLKARAAKRRRK